MKNMAHFILNDLPISSEIKEKIALIKSSKLDYQSFNDFRFLMTNLENFDVNYKLSENRIKAIINNFINKFVSNLNDFILKIKQEQTELELFNSNTISTQEKQTESFKQNKDEYFYNSTPQAKFFLILAELENIKNKEEHTKEEMSILLEKINELELNGDGLIENQLEVLHTSKEIVGEYFLSLNKEEFRELEVERMIKKVESFSSKEGENSLSFSENTKDKDLESSKLRNVEQSLFNENDFKEEINQQIIKPKEDSLDIYKHTRKNQ
ncbi:hypothetical protein [Helicobacter sp. MIT 14-3879]|uniref:hypothetical protein n=1 Tax=Helicobacter sp. MIT 14-3879 TaxID=2040649 RepID=UPI000E1EC995|nr:hypothetical protein [Helicobacter sp. MIT 14-3879]RDU61487.1 hypothetical protein CQA44_08740 [Helicobacter sp. MIT 14-3879]